MPGTRLPPDIVPTMSDHFDHTTAQDSATPARRGQSLVEFALVLPILTLLLVMAIDFGRVYFGWVSLTNAARVGANYAADNPNWTPENQTAYSGLIANDASTASDNCSLGTPPPPTFTRGGIPVANPELGDYATVNLTCTFTLFTPLAGQVLGSGTVSLSAESIFPVRDGCASCPPPPPAPEPQPPNQCREIPVMAGLSLAGARSAWQSAGFSLANFAPSTGSDIETVDFVDVDENDVNSGCPTWTPGNWAIFSSSAIAVLLAADATDPSCTTVPNLKGMTVANARGTWSVGFTGDFDPDDQDAFVVTDQTTDTPSDPGVSCRPPETTIVVSVGPAWAAPPPAPCKVPNFTGVKANNAETPWTWAGFTAANISYEENGNFTIQQQSLVGGVWVPCHSQIVVAP